MLDRAPGPVLTVVALDYPSGGRKPFPIEDHQDEVAGWARTLGFEEPLPGRAPARQLLLPTDITIPDWEEADVLLHLEGVPAATRRRIKPLYEKWRKSRNLQDIVRLLEQEMRT